MKCLNVFVSNSHYYCGDTLNLFRNIFIIIKDSINENLYIFIRNVLDSVKSMQAMYHLNNYD